MPGAAQADSRSGTRIVDRIGLEINHQAVDCVVPENACDLRARSVFIAARATALNQSTSERRGETSLACGGAEVFTLEGSQVRKRLAEALAGNLNGA
jgi:hypothetical protein